MLPRNRWPSEGHSLAPTWPAGALPGGLGKVTHSFLCASPQETDLQTHSEVCFLASEPPACLISQHTGLDSYYPRFSVCGSLRRKKGVGTERKKTKPQTRHKQQLPTQLLFSFPRFPPRNNRVGYRGNSTFHLHTTPRHPSCFPLWNAQSRPHRGNLAASSSTFPQNRVLQGCGQG